MAAIVERVGPVDRDILESLFDIVGGVPSLIHALCDRPDELSSIVYHPGSIWQVLGPLESELRHAVELATSDPQTSQRLLDLTHMEPAPQIAADAPLLESGLLRVHPIRGGVQLRSPLFAKLIEDQ